MHSVRLLSLSTFSVRGSYPVLVNDLYTFSAPFRPPLPVARSLGVFADSPTSPFHCVTLILAVNFPGSVDSVI